MRKVDPEKLRDMTRSILPSKYRTTIRQEKAQRKRAHRRVVRADIRHEDAEETAADLLRDVCVSDLVSWRRGGDKLNHFIRWCERRTRGMTRTDALAAVRAILPASLVGDHAYFHWEHHLERRAGKRVPYRERLRREAQSEYDTAVFRLRRALRVDPSLHGRLNAQIKALPDGHHRLLRGMHDVEAFVRATRRCIVHGVMLRVIAETEGRPQGRPFSITVINAAQCNRWSGVASARRGLARAGGLKPRRSTQRSA